MTGRRFGITHQHTVIFADRLRLGAYEACGRFHIAPHASDPADEDPSQAIVLFDLPKLARRRTPAVLPPPPVADRRDADRNPRSAPALVLAPTTSQPCLEVS